jgi:hypothetical protein
MSQAAKGGSPFTMTLGNQVVGEMSISQIIYTPGGSNESFILVDDKGKNVLTGNKSGTTPQAYVFIPPIEVGGLGLSAMSAGGTLQVFTA